LVGSQRATGTVAREGEEPFEKREKAKSCLRKRQVFSAANETPPQATHDFSRLYCMWCDWRRFSSSELTDLADYLDNVRKLVGELAEI
jgi:hypothetical protein